MTNTETLTYYVREVYVHTWARCTFPYSPPKHTALSSTYIFFF